MVSNHIQIERWEMVNEENEYQEEDKNIQKKRKTEQTIKERENDF